MRAKNWLIIWILLTTSVFANDNATLIASLTNSSVIFDRIPSFDHIQVDNSSIVFDNLSYIAKTFSYIIPDLNYSFHNKTQLISNLINVSFPNTTVRHVMNSYNGTIINMTLAFDVLSCGTLSRIEYVSDTGLYTQNYTTFSCSGGQPNLVLPGVEYSNESNILTLSWSPYVAPVGGARGRHGRGVVGEQIYYVLGEGIEVSQQTLLGVRGSFQETPVVLTNLYEDAVLENVKFEVQGELAPYVKITPVINSENLVLLDGKSASLSGSGQSVSFSLEDAKQHTITADKIVNDSVVLTVKSEPVSVNIKTGETKNIDINGDGKPDVAIPIKSITGNTVNFGIYRLGPPDPKKIYFLEDRRYDFGIIAPKYMEKGTINLTVNIEADVVAINPAKTGFDRKKLSETRIIPFRVIGVSRQEALDAIKEANDSIKKANGAGFSTVYLNNLLKKAQYQLNEKDYDEAFNIANGITMQIDSAFKANQLINEIEKLILEAKGKLLKTTETENALSLVKRAFEREDYITALGRAQETQLTLFLETRGRVNMLWFIQTYWPFLVIASIIIYLLVLFAYRRIMIAYIGKKIAELTKEEHIIDSLIKAAQSSLLTERKSSAEECLKKIADNEAILNEIMKQKIALKNKRMFLLETDKALADVKKEEQELIEILKESQRRYLVEGKLTRSRFEQIYETEQKRFAELEKEERELKKKLSNKTEKYIGQRLVNYIWNRLKGKK